MFDLFEQIQRVKWTTEQVQHLQSVWPDFKPLDLTEEEMDIMVVMLNGWRC